jgi:small-conductance mechanosensitive channel
MRSTVVTTLDNISIIVPNSQFVSEAIINWTHNDEIVRIQIPVGVAYGSDTTLVKQALLEVAHDHPQIMKSDHPDTPAVRKPLVRFINFGDSSLDFQLLAWIASVQQQFDIISDLHFMIDRKFREYGIAIPFPQRDVHLYSESDAQPSLVAPSNVAAKGFSERSNRESSL